MALRCTVGHSSSSRDVICRLRKWFADVGVPSLLITDGGPQFSSGRFAQFCQRWNVEHRISTPHYPQSNGHAKSAVKAVKYLILKTTKNGDLDTDAFQRGLLEWCNSPRESGHSPAQILFGHPLQSFVFAHRSSFSTEWQQKSDSIGASHARANEKVENHYNISARPLQPLKIDDRVDIQHHQTKRWSLHGNRRDYYVKLPSGRVLWRNHGFLRPYLSPTSANTECAATTRKPNNELQQPLRRSTHQRRSPARLNISTTAGLSYD